jgi:hypothetical protein
MNKLLPSIVAAVAAGGLVASACTVNSTTTNNGPDGSTQGDDDSGNQPETAPATDTGVQDVFVPPVYSAQVRFANWSPDSPSVGYDFCVAVHGTTAWQGPILGQISGDAGVIGDGGVSSLQFPTVTGYTELDFQAADDGGIPPMSQQLDFEIVSEGGNCATTADSTTPFTTLPTLSNGGFYTVAIVGDTSTSGTNDPGLNLVGFADDTTAGSGALVRFINAGPSVASADFGTGSIAGTNFSALVSDIAFGTAIPGAGSGVDAGSDAGSTGPLDANGYLSLTAATSTFSVHPSGQTNTDTAIASSQTVANGDKTTMVLIGAKSGAMTKPAFLVCKGDGTASTALVSSCTQVSM